MKYPARTITHLALVLTAIGSSVTAAADLRAFPGAEGYGALASGGRGGDVYIVTNRNDSGAGSFREAFNYSGTTPRTIVFETSGTINLDARLTLNTKSNITIAGHTAPGGGVLVRGDSLSINNCSNLIIRHMRFRYENADADRDALAMSASTNVMLDHLSTSWGRDECLSLTNAVNQITVQNCIIAEATRVDHQYGSLINSTAPNGRITLWRNLYINNAGRTPRAASQNGEDFVFEFKNNVIYNWGVEGDWGSESCVSDNERATWNMVNNLFIAGPNTTKNFFEDLLNRYSSTILRGGSGNDNAYLSGNKVDSDRDGTLDPGAASWSNTQGDINQLAEPRAIDTWAEISQVQSPEDALAAIIAGAGAYPWNRDTVDARFIEELQSYGTDGGIRTSIPSFPTIATGTAPADTDRDGMPDSWETWYGTDPAVKTNNLIAPNGYTALENYLQWLLDPDSVTPLPAEEEGEGSPEGEGIAEGTPEGSPEGSIEGTPEGEGATEGIIEGTPEGEGAPDGEGTPEGEGIIEGLPEGDGAGDGEGSPEGEAPCDGNLLDDAGFEAADITQSWGAEIDGVPSLLLYETGESSFSVASGKHALLFYPRVTADILRVAQAIELDADRETTLTFQLYLAAAANGKISLGLGGTKFADIDLSTITTFGAYQTMTFNLPAQSTASVLNLSIANGSLSGGAVLMDDFCLVYLPVSEGQGEGSAEGVSDGEGIREGSTEGEGQPEGEGAAEGVTEGEGGIEGIAEGLLEGEGTPEGVLEGLAEGIAEGPQEGEGLVEGTPEGIQEGEGSIDGAGEGDAEGAAEGEGARDGEGISEGEGLVEGEAESGTEQSADLDGDQRINLFELLRLIQLYNAQTFHCEVSGEDGFAIGAGDTATCPPHTSDYQPQDWSIALGELLRLIQFYNFGNYHPCDSEDGYCPGLPG